MGFGKIYQFLKQLTQKFPDGLYDLYTWFVTFPLWPIKDMKMQSLNSLIDKQDLLRCRNKIREMRHSDKSLGRDLVKKKIEGLKAWEYCVILDAIPHLQDKRIFDVGCGGSTFCYYLARKGTVVTTFDLPSPIWGLYEQRKRWRYRNLKVDHVCGNILELSFQDEQFDLVICISTIEHLHQYSNTPNRAKPYDEFIQETKQALIEMGRVVKRGGYIYITSDLYDPDLQKDDKWWGSEECGQIVCAYRYNDFDNIFLKTLRNQGFIFDRGYDYNFDLVRNDSNRANYRGRYITTFSLLMKKSDSQYS